MVEECPYVPVTLNELPDVPLLKVFSFLEIKDRLRCAQVCKKWNELIFTPSVWRTLNVIHIDKDGRCEYELNYYDSQSYSKVRSGRGWILLDGGYIRIVDEFDYELQETFWKAEVPLYKKVISEYKLLIGGYVNGLIKRAECDNSKCINYITMSPRFIRCLESVLPRVGANVKNLSLIANSGLSDFIFNLYLILCPNVENIDVRYTSLTGDAFKDVHNYGSCQKIKSINLMGCKKVTDNTLWNLADCWKREKTSSLDIERKSIGVPYLRLLTRYVCSEVITIEDSVFHGFFSNSSPINIKTFTCPIVHFSPSIKFSGLKHLCLAGCTQITDKGLQYLADCKFISDLEVLDVSGCSGLTSSGLNVLAKVCPKLKAGNLFYCDMIADGPFSQEANGCLTEGGVCCMN